MVYFIGNREKECVKIGFTQKEVYQRWMTIQTNCPFKVEILLFLEGMKSTEKYIQELFKDYKIRGEWYNLSSEVLEFINNPTLPLIDETFKFTERIDKGDDVLIEELWLKGMNRKQIAKETGYTYWQVVTYVKRRKLFTKYPDCKRRRYPKGTTKSTRKYFLPTVAIANIIPLEYTAVKNLGLEQVV